MQMKAERGSRSIQKKMAVISTSSIIMVIAGGKFFHLYVQKWPVLQALRLLLFVKIQVCTVYSLMKTFLWKLPDNLYLI